jgi:hypothetical protein
MYIPEVSSWGDMKSISIFAFFLFFSVTTASADSFVSVVLEPTQFNGFAGIVNGTPTFASETVGASFDWDITNQNISNVVLTATGPWGTGLSNVPSVMFDDSGAILIMNFDGGGSEFQLNYLNHDPGGFPHLASTPGTYVTDLGFFCGQCLVGTSDFELGTAVVSPIATPEPSTALLVVAGLIALFLWGRNVRSKLQRLARVSIR